MSKTKRSDNNDVRSRRWAFQFRIRTLLLLVLLASIPSYFGWVEYRERLAWEKAWKSPIRRISDPDEMYGKGLVEIDFSTDAAGVPLAEGDDVHRKFEANGCRIESSVPNSRMVTHTYKVRRESGPFSCANATPQYVGTAIITFCDPDNPNRAATVTSVGCYVSFVSPGGTLLRAYTADDELIGEVAAESNGFDFLGLTSRIPIARVEISPNPNIDPDFAFDDLVFDRPRPYSWRGPRLPREDLAQGREDSTE